MLPNHHENTVTGNCCVVTTPELNSTRLPSSALNGCSTSAISSSSPVTSRTRASERSSPKRSNSATAISASTLLTTLTPIAGAGGSPAFSASANWPMKMPSASQRP